jgi:hypothetical protein
MVPWKYHIEHANENPFTYITNIADRDVVVDRFGRVWIPQRKSVILGCELVPINVEGWVDWHGGEEAESVLVGIAHVIAIIVAGVRTARY